MNRLLWAARQNGVLRDTSTGVSAPFSGYIDGEGLFVVSSPELDIWAAGETPDELANRLRKEGVVVLTIATTIDYDAAEGIALEEEMQGNMGEPDLSKPSAIRKRGSIVFKVSITLRPGRDDDLIEVLSATPRGMLSSRLRQLMRNGGQAIFKEVETDFTIDMGGMEGDL